MGLIIIGFWILVLGIPALLVMKIFEVGTRGAKNAREAHPTVPTSAAGHYEAVGRQYFHYGQWVYNTNRREWSQCPTAGVYQYNSQTGEWESA
jgi:hypothetical protein